MEVKRSFCILLSDRKLMKQIVLSCYIPVNLIINARGMLNSFLECWSSSAFLAFYYEFCSIKQYTSIIGGLILCAFNMPGLCLNPTG